MKKARIFFVIDLVITVFLTALILILALANGSTSGQQSSRITALINNTLSLFTPRQIQEVKMESISANIPESMESGDVFTLDCSVYPIDTTDPSLTYSSSNPSVLNITQEGILTAISKGESTISIHSTRHPEVKVEQVVSIKRKPIQNVILPSLLSLHCNEVYPISFQVEPETADQADLYYSVEEISNLKVIDQKYLFCSIPGTYSLNITCPEQKEFQKTLQVQVLEEAYTLAKELKITSPEEVILNKEFSISVDFSSEVQEKTYQINILTPDYVKATENGYIAIKEREIQFSVLYLATGLSQTVSIQAIKIRPKQLSLSTDATSYRVGDVIHFSLSSETVDATLPICKYTLSDDSLGTITEEGSLLLVKTGSLTVTATSQEEASLSASLTFDILSKSFIAQKDMKQAEAFIRKAVGHFSLFMVLGIFLLLTLFQLSKLSQNNHFKEISALSIASLVYCFLVAGLSEIFQALTDNRGPSFLDVLLDTGGSLTGIVIVFLILLLILLHQRKKIPEQKAN